MRGVGIIYTSTTLIHPSPSDLLHAAIETLLSATSKKDAAQTQILWSLSYKQSHPTYTTSNPPLETGFLPVLSNSGNQQSGIIHLKDLGPSLAFEDEVLRDVKTAWERITADDGDARGGFMSFEDREGIDVDDGENLR